VGAYKNASEEFEALYPGVKLSLFAVAAQLFRKGAINAEGAFAPHFRNEDDRTTTIRINGSETADISGADHVLLVGHRFAFGNIIDLLEDFDVMEGVRTGRPKLISETFLKEIIETLTTIDIDRALAVAKGYDGSATFVMAPYPASTIVERAPKYAAARVFDQFWGRPDAVWIFEYWLAFLQQALEARGHRLLMQPEELNAAPYATLPEYALRPTDLEGGTLPRTDYRHMNADFGLAMLREYADKHLGLSPHEDAQTELKERTA